MNANDIIDQTLTDEQIETYEGQARRDDWYGFFFGSDIRLLIGDLKRARAAALALESSLPAETVSEEMLEKACSAYEGAFVHGDNNWRNQMRAAIKAAALAHADDGWRPIESAPRIPDRPIDLWIVPGKPLVGERWKPYRETDAHLSGNGKHWLTKTGHYIEGLRYHDHFDRDDRGPDATIVTHYRLPTPPVGDR